ncbi:MAG TPA: hypothetical protein VF992_00785 [Thermoplasmata archaeon]
MLQGPGGSTSLDGTPYLLIGIVGTGAGAALGVAWVPSAQASPTARFAARPPALRLSSPPRT